MAALIGYHVLFQARFARVTQNKRGSSHSFAIANSTDATRSARLVYHRLYASAHTMTASSSALDLAALSRKELQALAKEFQLCRGNAKSDVILQHVQQFVAVNPADGEARVRAALDETGGEGVSAASEPLSASPRTESPHEVVATKSPNATTTTASPVAEKKKSVITPSKDTSAPAAKKQQTPEPKKSPGKSAPVASASPIPAKKAKTVAVATSSPAPAAKKSPAKADATLPSKVRVTKQTPPTKAALKSPITAETVTAKSVVQRSSNATPSPQQQPKARLQAPDTTIEALVSAADDLAFIGDGSRVRCTTTGHEMQADVAVVTAHVHGKRYARARLQRQSFASFAPMFTPHPDEKKKAQLLWCHVTETEHPRDVTRVKSHMAGVRYQKELPRWQADEAARVQAEHEAAARAAAKAQARAAKRQQLEAEAAGVKPRKGAVKKKSVKRSREETTGADKKEKATEPKKETKEDVTVVGAAEEHKPEAKRRRKRKHARKL